MALTLMKGSEAIAEAAIRAGARFFFGYPITPQTEIPEYMSARMPEIGGCFLQAESEVAAINMVYGAAGTGARVITSSSSPGVSLKQEGISYCAGAMVPAVIINVMRGGPGLGNIQASQGDYFQGVKGGGNGDYHLLTYAPSSIQEFIDIMMFAYEKAEKYRIPVLFLADGIIAQVRDLTGHSPMLPLWAYGFFQSKERYHTQEESLNVLKKYRELQIPIDCMIQDWRYWPEYQKTDSAWNSHSFDPERFPNPKKWADEIHKLNAKLMIVAWPGFGTHTEQRKELDAKGMIINFDTWPPQSGARPYDVYNPEARDIYWK